MYLLFSGDYYDTQFQMEIPRWMICDRDLIQFIMFTTFLTRNVIVGDIQFCFRIVVGLALYFFRGVQIFQQDSLNIRNYYDECLAARLSALLHEPDMN